MDTVVPPESGPAPGARAAAVLRCAVQLAGITFFPLALWELILLHLIRAA